MRRLLMLLATALTAALLYAFFVEARRVTVQEIAFAHPDIPPAFDGKRIAFLTDIHHGPQLSRERVRAVVAMTNALRPDLVLLGGDYAYTDASYLAPCLQELAHLEAPLGKFGVLGNHDHWYDAPLTRRLMIEAGIGVLENNARWITLGDQWIRLGGVGDLWEGWQDLSATTTGATDDDFIILLSHNPDYAEYITTTKIDLVLSGHTHGGQVTLFGLWAPLTPSRYGQKYRSGVVRTDFTTVIISNGIGTIAPHVRFFAPPQIVLICLERAAPADSNRHFLSRRREERIL